MKANHLRHLLPCLFLMLSALPLQAAKHTITSTFTNRTPTAPMTVYLETQEKGCGWEGIKSDYFWVLDGELCITKVYGETSWTATMTSEYTITGSVQSIKLSDTGNVNITAMAGNTYLGSNKLIQYDHDEQNKATFTVNPVELKDEHITLIFSEIAGSENSVFCRFPSIEVTYYDPRKPADLSWSSNTATVMWWDNYIEPTLINPHGLKVTKTSSDPNVATVDDQGFVSYQNPGTTTITVSFAGDDDYAPGEASYTLTVESNEVDINGLKYKLNPQALTAEVIRNSTQLSGDIVVPSTVTYSGKTYTVTAIGRSAFLSCRNLLSVTIPNTVTSIGQQAFSYCDALKTMTIPKSVTSINRAIFSYDNNMETIVVEAGNPVYSSPNNCNAIILTAENKLIQGCKATVIPEGVECIGEYAFNGFSELKTIKLPSSLKAIEYLAFYQSGLTSIVIPKGMTNLSHGSFHSCVDLTSIRMESGGTKYSSPAGSNAIVETASGTLIVGCQTTIIPKNIKRIEQNAFAGHTPITELTIPNGVEEIGSAAFQYTNIETIVLPHSVKKVEDGIFSSCAKLKTVYIGSGLESMRRSVFYDCNQLTDFYLAATKVPKTEYSFAGLPTSIVVTLHVPAESVEAYQQDRNWSVFNIVAWDASEFPEIIEEEVTTDSADVEGSYKLWVNGIRVSDTNRLDVLGDKTAEDNPSVMFDGDHTLVLCNAELDSIVSQLSDELVIYLQGDNKIGNNASSAIHHTRTTPIPLTITTSGNYPGTLTITSNVALTEGFSQTKLDHITLLAGDNRKAVYGVVINPFTKDAVVTFRASDFMTIGDDGELEEIDLSNRVVNNILYTLRQENEDGFWEEEQAMVLNTVMPFLPSFGDGIVGSESFAESYAGMTFMIPAGTGDILIDNKTMDGYMMAVRIGSGMPNIFTNSDWKQNTIHYQVDAPTYVYLYNAGSNSAASDRQRGGKKTTTRIVVHSIVIKPQNISSSNEVQGIIPSSQTIDMNPVIVDTHISDLYVNRKNAGSWYNLNGQQMDRPLQRGIYILNGRKVIVK